MIESLLPDNGTKELRQIIDISKWPKSDGEKIFGLMSGLKENCRKCGVEFTVAGMYVPNMKKAYPLFEHCELHRASDLKLPQEATNASLSSKRLEESWEKQVPYPVLQHVDVSTLDRQVEHIGKGKVDLAEFAQKFQYGRGLWMVGDVGTYKTRAMHAILERFFYRGRWVKIFYPGDFVREYFKALETKGLDRFITTATTTSCLYFDDFGKDRLTKEGETNAPGSVLFEIFDKRCLAGKPTFFTTNFEAKELASERLPIEGARGFLRRVLDHCEIVKTGKSETVKNLSF